MAKQYAKAGDYGRVNGWLASPTRTMRMDRAERQAFNKLALHTYRAKSETWKNGSRKMLVKFKDGRRFEGHPLKDGTGDWVYEKCTR